MKKTLTNYDLKELTEIADKHNDITKRGQWRAQMKELIVLETRIAEITKGIKHHPDNWDLPCWCDECLSDL